MLVFERLSQHSSNFYMCLLKLMSSVFSNTHWKNSWFVSVCCKEENSQNANKKKKKKNKIKKRGRKNEWDAGTWHLVEEFWIVSIEMCL